MAFPELAELDAYRLDHDLTWAQLAAEMARADLPMSPRTLHYWCKQRARRAPNRSTARCIKSGCFWRSGTAAAGGEPVSYLVTRIVRAVLLPPTFAERVLPAAKGVLLALADDCHDDGLGPCHPSLLTLAREAGLGRCGVMAALRRLQHAGLIFEQQPPTKRRPRTWGLHLARLAALVDPEAWLSESDTQLVRRLAADASDYRVDRSRPEDGHYDLWSCPEERHHDVRGREREDSSDFARPLNGGDSQSHHDTYGMYGIQNDRTVTPSARRDDRRDPPPDALAALQAVKTKVFAKTELRPQRRWRHA